MARFYNKFKYLINLSFIIFLILFLIFIFNYIVNPYKYFSKQGILAKGNFLTISFFSSAPSDLIMYKMTQDIKNTNFEKIIIGSSRILYGIDTCNSDFLKVGIPGITVNETKILLTESFKKEKIKEIFIEISISNENRGKMSIIKPSFWDSNFTFNTLFISLKSLVEYIFSDKNYTSPNCKFLLNSKSLAYTKEEDYIKYYQDFLTNNFDEKVLSYIKSLMQEYKNYNKKIIFFISPINSKIYFDKFDLLKTSKFKNRINSIKKKYGEFIFINDYRLDNLNNQNNLWYDLNHFKPELGNKLINEFNKY